MRELRQGIPSECQRRPLLFAGVPDGVLGEVRIEELEVLEV